MRWEYKAVWVWLEDEKKNKRWLADVDGETLPLSRQPDPPGQ
jgi:hypothetical protein